MNESIVKALAQTSARLKVINTSAGKLKKGPTYHFKRLSRNILGAICLMLLVNSGKKRLYTVVEPGYGMIYNFLLVAVARMGNFQILLHHHSAVYAKAFSKRFSLLARLAGGAALHVALDDVMASDLNRRYGLGRIMVAHNACHIPDPGLPVARHERPLTCGFLSNLSLEKGLDTFFNTMRAVRRLDFDTRILLAGPIADFKSEELIKDAKAEFGDVLTVLGPVAGQTKDLFFRSIDVFLFPSRYRYEAQPLVIIEAMSYGIPVVTTNQGYSKELIGDAGICANGDVYVEQARLFIAKCASDISFYERAVAEARRTYQKLQSVSFSQLEVLKAFIATSGSGSFAAKKGGPHRSAWL